MSTIIFPSSFGATPIFFALIHSDHKVIIDEGGFFYKQTFRNRANVLSPNGIIPLVIPVLGGRKYSTPLKNIRIDYTENWIHKHIRALETYYYSSPFFEILADDIKAIYNNKFEYLWQLNRAFIKYFVELLDINLNHTEFGDTNNISKNELLDLRKLYSPKRDYLHFFDIDYPKYYQVYRKNNKFIKELSIFDLVFNTGSEAGLYIRQLAKNLKIIAQN